MEKIVKKGGKDVKGFQKNYLEGLDTLDVYLDLVELPPVESGNYSGGKFDTKVGRSARIT